MSTQQPVPFTLSNFRKEETIQDWPYGCHKRGPAIFKVEENKRGQRMLRTTFGKPKASNYFSAICLADGSDGKTHLVAHTSQYSMVKVMSCDMKYDDYILSELNPGDNNEFSEYLAALYAVAK